MRARGVVGDGGRQRLGAAQSVGGLGQSVGLGEKEAEIIPRSVKFGVTRDGEAEGDLGVGGLADGGGAFDWVSGETTRKNPSPACTSLWDPHAGNPAPPDCGSGNQPNVSHGKAARLGQREEKHGSLTGDRVGPDPATMPVDDPAYGGQANPRALEFVNVV